jgi:hypothetical protein
MNKKILFMIFPLIIGVGIFLRFYNLRGTQFTWDQENLIAYPAADILINHHLTLIGGKASIGNLYLGPLYSYLAALFFAIFNLDPIAGAVLASFLSVITTIFGFLLVKKLFGIVTAVYFILIWSVSTFVIHFDRIPWNVNILPLSSLLTTCGLLFALENRRKLGWLLVGIGLFLGMNSQFSVVLFIFIILLLLFLNKKIIDWSVLIAFILLSLSVLPLIVFELRHGFPAVGNLYTFSASSITKFSQIIVRMRRIGGLILESTGRVLLFDGLSWIQKTLGLFLLISLAFLIKKDKKIRNFFQVYILYLVVYFLCFSFYSNTVSEYYFIGILPVSVIGVALLFEKIQEKYKEINFLIAILSIIILNRSYSFVQNGDSHSLGIKQQILSKIKEESGDKPISVVYDMETGWSYGYDYLLDYYKIKKTNRENTADIFWLSFPKSRFPGKPDYILGDFALGLPSTSQKILATKNVDLYNLLRLRIPREWVVLQCPDVDFDNYLLTEDKSASCVSSSGGIQLGVLVRNLPNCNLKNMKDKKELKIQSQLLFYTAGEMIITALEKDRCIVLTDLGNKEIFPVSSIMSDILESARR